MQLSAFFVVLVAIFLVCDNPIKNVNDVHEGTIKENRVICHANQIYLGDIENSKKEAAIAFDSNSEKIAAYKLKIDTKKGKCKYAYRQSILKLELQNSYMKMTMEAYEPEGEEKWKIFKAKFACQLLELSAEFAGFSERN